MLNLLPASHTFVVDLSFLSAASKQKLLELVFEACCFTDRDTLSNHVRMVFFKVDRAFKVQQTDFDDP
jgi:hypothetical protein